MTTLITWDHPHEGTMLLSADTGVVLIQSVFWGHFVFILAAGIFCILLSGMDSPSCSNAQTKDRKCLIANCYLSLYRYCCISPQVVQMFSFCRATLICFTKDRCYTYSEWKMYTTGSPACLQNAFRGRKQVWLLPENRLLCRGNAVRGEELA